MLNLDVYVYCCYLAAANPSIDFVWYRQLDFARIPSPFL